MRTIYFFIMDSILLGFGLSADAFSVSVANGIQEPEMRPAKALAIAGAFALFQALMPMTGWFLTNTILEYFQTLQKVLPLISQLFLICLGVDMIIESRKQSFVETAKKGLRPAELLLQAIATSIDALLVGLTIAQFQVMEIIVCSLIIATVTFILCFVGVHWGRKLGLKLAGRSTVLGGVILILIAAEHFISCHI